MSSKAPFAFFFILFSGITCFDDPHIIIIGAGAAGIASATRLYQYGFKNIIILEAENRIGGRIYSLKFNDAYIDLGAQWCEGERDNVVYEMVKDLNVLELEEDNSIVYHSKLKRLDRNFSNNLLELFDVTYGEVPNDHHGSLGEYLLERYNEAIHKTWGHDIEKLALAEDCVDLFKKGVEENEGVFSWFDVAIGSVYKASDGNLTLGWNGFGFKTILDVLMQKFPISKVPLPLDDRIILNKAVEKIVWSSTEKVLVQCADGTKYTSDHIIWTPSVGVLKHNHQTIFTPQLPMEKIAAINAMGYKACLKILIHFPDRWWNDEFTAFAFAWAPDDLQKSGKEFVEGPKKEGRSWITAITTITAVPKHPNLLLMWAGGDFIPEIEKTSDETIKNGILYTLEKFLGEDYKNISRPDKVFRKNWYADPHFYGTFLFETVQSKSLDRPQGEVLAEPLLTEHQKPIILFAGEATNPVHYSSVHGAIESGFREADRLKHYYKQLNV